MQIETPAQHGDKFAAVFSYDETASANMPAVSGSLTSLMLTGNGMEKAFRLAEMMATGMVSVPQHLKGNPADCLAVVIQALQWDMNPYAVAQESHVTKSGQLGFGGKLIASVVITRGPVVGMPTYEHHGDWSKVRGKFEKRKGNNGGEYLSPTYTAEDEKGLFVRVSLLMKGEEKPRTLDVYMDQCQPRFSTQWANDPEQQICYAAIRKWARRNTPNVILGVYAEDEVETQAARNMGSADVVHPGAYAAAPAQAHPKQAEADAAAQKGVAAYAEFWSDKGTTKAERMQLAPGHEARKKVALEVDAARTLDNDEGGKPASASGETATTYDSVKKRLDDAKEAKSLGALNDAANLIGALSDPDQQLELEALYEAHLAAIQA